MGYLKPRKFKVLVNQDKSWFFSLTTLSVIVIIGLFIILVPRNLGAFYVPAADSGNSGRITSASPLGETPFKPPRLVADIYQRYQSVIEINGKLYWPNQDNLAGLVPLTPDEIVTYERIKNQPVFTKEAKESPVIEVNNSSKKGKDKFSSDETEENEKQLPPGIQKQGEDKQEDQGKHLGWEKGNHYGWDKKPENDKKTMLSELNLSLVSKDSEAKAKKEIKLEDKKTKERPRLNLENLPKPVNKDADALSLLQKISEIKLENGKTYPRASMSGAPDRIKIKSLPIGVR